MSRPKPSDKGIHLPEQAACLYLPPTMFHPTARTWTTSPGCLQDPWLPASAVSCLWVTSHRHNDHPNRIGNDGAAPEETGTFAVTASTGVWAQALANSMAQEKEMSGVRTGRAQKTLFTNDTVYDKSLNGAIEKLLGLTKTKQYWKIQGQCEQSCPTSPSDNETRKHDDAVHGNTTVSQIINV